jgi:hypothetical protein
MGRVAELRLPSVATSNQNIRAITFRDIQIKLGSTLPCRSDWLCETYSSRTGRCSVEHIHTLAALLPILQLMFVPDSPFLILAPGGFIRIMPPPPHNGGRDYQRVWRVKCLSTIFVES